MAVNGWNGKKLIDTAVVGWKWLGTVGNCWKWLYMAGMAGKGRKLLEITGNSFVQKKQQKYVMCDV